MVYKCMRPKIVIATNNRGKLKEIKALLGVPAVDFLSLSEAGAESFQVDEIYDTYVENALLKAKKAAELTGLPAIADDSGLEVDALDGAPGVRSARFAGEDASDEKNMEKLLELLEDVADEDRTARFRCIAVAYFPEEDVYFTAEGVCEGKIIREKRGDKGFGYDPVFVPDGYEETFAELGEAVKNKISHRSKAFRLLRRKLIDFLEL
jgi:XTP/dITP diphosphohydrolase